MWGWMAVRKTNEQYNNQKKTKKQNKEEDKGFLRIRHQWSSCQWSCSKARFNTGLYGMVIYNSMAPKTIRLGSFEKQNEEITELTSFWQQSTELFAKSHREPRDTTRPSTIKETRRYWNETFETMSWWLETSALGDEEEEHLQLTKSNRRPGQHPAIKNKRLYQESGNFAVVSNVTLLAIITTSMNIHHGIVYYTDDICRDRRASFLPPTPHAQTSAKD